ncbi:CoA ester lyase [Gordonia jinghuaiqii]|uniref:CoA ester lyase n=1 Tax=Gordonia jinghuaiqii TaxID=2758710 RepID=A0A7D7LTA4_9ACTN|nr:CoA ester lyase [Gordonia jinghuaiqii]MCR5979187.1 CoA ester lyase [Gordonia jinghuaiqii]QMT00981.1 CoA ester lyase [Gordonia jinghuaiqii]
MTSQPTRPGWLFCPADRPDRYTKALAVADVVILDLEDAVSPTNKSAARSAVTDLIRTRTYEAARTVVRIHGAGDPQHQSDLDLVAKCGLETVMLAKAEGPQDLSSLQNVSVIALIETPLGLERCSEIADAPCVTGLMWGADDLVAGLGGHSARFDDGSFRDIARFARARVLTAAKARGLLALDGVHMDIGDTAGLQAECEDAVAVGFDATAAIHPSQVPVIQRAYAPSSDQLDWARALLEATADNPGVTTFRGRMVDGPVYAQARRIVDRAAVAMPADDSATTHNSHNADGSTIRASERV